MSVRNILDENGKVHREYTPAFVDEKLKAIEEFIRVMLEAVELDGYIYTGVFQNVPPAVANPTEETTEPIPSTTVVASNAEANTFVSAASKIPTEDPVSENPQNVA